MTSILKEKKKKEKEKISFDIFVVTNWLRAASKQQQTARQKIVFAAFKASVQRINKKKKKKNQKHKNIRNHKKP